MDYNSTTNQEIKRKLVEREVICNLNSTIEHLRISNYGEYDSDFDDLFYTPDYEPAVREDLENLSNSGLLSVLQDLNIEFDDKEWMDKDIAQEIIKENKDDLIKDEYCSLFHLLEENSLTDEKDELFVRHEIIDCIMNDEDFDFSEYANDNNLDYDYIEAYEFWNVSDFLGRKLREQGETVVDILDFTVWARCTTGQAILLDGVISRIAEDMEILEGQEYSWE